MRARKSCAAGTTCNASQHDAQSNDLLRYPVGLTFNHGVAGSSPAGLTNKTVSGPETWVTERT
jgi:hypothetical protein